MSLHQLNCKWVANSCAAPVLQTRYRASRHPAWSSPSFASTGRSILRGVERSDAYPKRRPTAVHFVLSRLLRWRDASRSAPKNVSNRNRVTLVRIPRLGLGRSVVNLIGYVVLPEASFYDRGISRLPIDSLLSSIRSVELSRARIEARVYIL